MKKIDIVFAINDAYTRHLNIAIYSLLTNNQNRHFNIHILCKSLTTRNQESIKKILDVFNNASIDIVELKNEADRFSKMRISVPHISIETYYRYILADLFPGVDKVIYLDADILVSGKIDKLYDTDIDDFYIAGVNERDIIKRVSGYKETIGFKKNELYVNAGVLLMNLNKIREDSLVEVLFENTVKLQDIIWFQDQDIINITMRNNIKQISEEYNYTDQAREDGVMNIDKVKIIHYNGGLVKPWENKNYPEFQRPFMDMYDRYVDEYNKKIYGTQDKFALLSYSTENIGDDIQSVAARRFLPRIDYFIDRDKLGDWKNFHNKENIKFIVNGWLMHSPFKWPIQERTLDPLYISLYTEQLSPEFIKKFLSRKSRDLLKAYGPIGARDEATLHFLNQNNIEAYLSGCMTLTLQKDERIKKQDLILLTDVSDEVYAFVKKSTKKRVVNITNAINTTLMSPQQRLELAELYLYLYQSAHCVITERLHSALPCLALETPTLLIKKDNPIGGNKSRLAGLSELVNHYTESEFIEGGVYNIEKPPQNPKTYVKYRNSLIKKAKQFTGYDNTDSFAWSDISSEKFNDVLQRLDGIMLKNLKDATIELMKSHHQISKLQESVNEKNAFIDMQNIEINKSCCKKTHG